MLSACSAEAKRVRGLEIGADDYLVSPFSFRELVDRVRALLRRQTLNGGNGSSLGDRIVVGDIVLDRAGHQVWRAGRLIEMPQREYDVGCWVRASSAAAAWLARGAEKPRLTSIRYAACCTSGSKSTMVFM